VLDAYRPALVLAPMDGITDAPMRALQGLGGAFTYAVSEFIRVSGEPLPKKVFLREVPELAHGGLTPTGLLVQVQILGGDPEPMAVSAANAVRAGAIAIDINFGCPAPTVNRNDGGASLLRYPCRIRDIVSAVRGSVPAEIPVSAKLRLGWDTTDAIHENAAMAAEGGASWLTIHARTRVQSYQPPVYWEPVAQVRKNLDIPIIANGDLWTLDDFHRCQDETGCIHFMIGRGALANPELPYQIASELGIARAASALDTDWERLFRTLLAYTEMYGDRIKLRALMRLKQWLKIAHNHGEFDRFDVLKHAESVDEFFEMLAA
jgi:tRNA-dihydrouridine synthase C